jgi:hypothetical protein
MHVEQRIEDELLLAAIERAECHQQNQTPGVLLSALVGHLGLVHGSWTTQRVRPQLEELQAAGFVERSRRHGCVLWGLTKSGHKRLDAARGDIGPLPESPQHRKWRDARFAASERIDGFREDVRRAVDEVMSLLDADPQTLSDVWFELSKRLGGVCWVLGSATYCLSEWQEPDDAHADIDTDEYRGRRNVWQWEDR